MDHMNQYVPFHDTDDPEQIVFGGDLLTVQNAIGVQEDRRDSRPQARWGGMIPCNEDWHALANFYQVGSFTRIRSILIFKYITENLRSENYPVL